MLDKTFDPTSFETALYERWEASGCFNAGQPGREKADPFTIVIPPPNVTGSLHIGHALNNTLQDVMVRYHRMKGDDTLWMPGTDHAGIATQMVVERQLAQTQQPGRRELGREEFLRRVWAWKAESGGTITRQLRRLGASVDWPRERFTMDEGLSKAVIEVFVRLHRDGLIYRDTRLVNWDPVFQTAISDLEVESREVKGSLWHIRYPVEGGGEIVVATTRPETMLADTAVAVHPEDERYAALVGKHVILPITGRRIPIVADAYSDPEKGTGAVKITPAHDFNDFEVGRRHSLGSPSMLDAEGRVTLAEIGRGSDFLNSLDGLDRFEARKRIVAELEATEALVLVEPHTHQVPHGDRSGVPIEPRLTMQWYVDAATLAQKPIEAVETGRVKFEPKLFENTFFAWMRDIQPWCVSRQLWWGHQIPAWYAPDGQVFVARSEAEAQELAGAGVALTRDPDVLDTWFSSALWPFSTLGWPEQTPALDKHYPTNVLVTGFDIIFFWVARMMMMGEYCTGVAPFSTVVIHGLVRDEKGQKMSKSKGNVMDPLELIDAYGADAVRFTLCALASPGRDIKLAKQRMEGYRAFATKIWNAARFLEMNGIAPDPAWKREDATAPLARWILEKTDAAVASAAASIEAFRFDDYASGAYAFTWGTFCDWFIELAKPTLSGEATDEQAQVKGAAQYALGTILKLLHPVMPYITAELWEKLGYGDAVGLVTAEWPAVPAFATEDLNAGGIDWAIGFIEDIRATRGEFARLDPANAKAWLGATLPISGPGLLAQAGGNAGAIARLAKVTLGDAATGDAAQCAQMVHGGALYLISVGAPIDVAGASKAKRKDIEKLEKDLASTEARLANADFVTRAKPEVLEEMHERKRALGEKLGMEKGVLERLGG
ncbi:valine--tRNA ligase [Rhodovarius crocodyli]|uniref:Valine--tRNA ligase n=1 Tax=Rhodovarius crocodyli TaxID=1979269 RepID=A0A437MHE3_9PROT|nr:valine--tRNA ligase [Rhodovarius crocodyli]RVT97025.1 valine--tRNA ligase [Rhodovarius crocodyli]